MPVGEHVPDHDLPDGAWCRDHPPSPNSRPGARSLRRRHVLDRRGGRGARRGDRDGRRHRARRRRRREDDAPAVEGAVARAGAEDVIERLAYGLDTQLGPTWNGGVEVSFGQWQKLALARRFMRDDPLLLVLDEPTAALDAETEHALFERYAAGARDRADEHGRITVLVSHRFSIVRMADLIVVVDGARVAEVGTRATSVPSRA